MLDYIVIILYFCVIIAVGLWCSKGEKTSEHYLLGGRKTHFVAAGLACMMALLSSVSLVMVPGEIYNHGLTLFCLSGTIGFTLAIPSYLLFTKFYFRLGSFTPYEYLEYRYDSTVRAVVAISAFYTRTMYLGMVVYTTAKIFEASFHWSSCFSILLVGIIGMIYTIKGGAKAVIWTDVIQSVVLFGSFAIVIVILCFKIDGGMFSAITIAFREGHGLPQFSQPDFYSLSPYVRLLFFIMLYQAIVNPLTTACSDQIAIQRLLSTKNWQEGFKAQCVATICASIFTFILWFVGLALFTYYFQNPDAELVSGKGDAAFFHFVSAELPSPIPGLFIAGMLAAIMSTLSSGMNSMATVWLKEFHEKFINKNLTQEDEVRVSKLATLWIGCFVIGFGLALEYVGQWLTQTVSEVGTIFYLIGTVILPAFLFGVLSKKASSKLIWGYAFYSLGEGISTNLWYVLSRSSEQAWRLDHSAGFGWAGKLNIIYAIIPLLIGIILVLPYFYKKIRTTWKVRISSLIGLLCLGFAEGMFIWYFYSQYLISDVPKARSFAFVLPISFFLSIIALKLSPVQPKEKYQGLTLNTINEEILVKKK